MRKNKKVKKGSKKLVVSSTVDASQGDKKMRLGDMPLADTPSVLPTYADKVQVLKSLGEKPVKNNSADDHSGGEGMLQGQPVPLSAESLVTLLSTLQAEYLVSDKGDAAILMSITDAVSDALVKYNQVESENNSIAAVDGDIINLVSMLFDFILDDRSLAEPLKVLIARMQIPILKVALLDKTFFSNGGHPARRLLNEIANASMGWQTGVEVEAEPYYRKVDSIICRLLNDFDRNIGIFHELLTGFVTFRDTERRRIQMLERRTIDSEADRAKSEFARKVVRGIINDIVAEQYIPEIILELIEKAWSDVMFLVCLNGEDNEQWQSAQQTLKDLVWSVQPHDTAEERQVLLELVPGLLTRLRSGLERVSYSPDDLSVLLDELETLHLVSFSDVLQVGSGGGSSNLRVEKSTPLDQLEAVSDSSNMEDTVAEITMEFDALLAAGDDELDDVDLALMDSDSSSDALALDLPTISDSIIEPTTIELATAEPTTAELDERNMKLVDELTMGTWVEFNEKNEPPFRCRLAAAIKSTGKFIFVNQGGMKVAEKTRLALVMALSNGTVRLIKDEQVFDRALESVIDSLRHAKKTAGDS